MSLYSDLNEVLTPYAQKIKGLAAADEEIKADLTITTYESGADLEYGYINSAGETKNDKAGSRRRTDFIPVTPGAEIKYLGENYNANVNGISFYDKNAKYISGDSNSGTAGTYSTVTVPENAYFARISTIKGIGCAVGLERTQSSRGPAYTTLLRIAELEKTDTAYVTPTGSNLSGRNGTKQDPFRTITYAISRGYRKIIAMPGLYNENISLDGGIIEILPWADKQIYSAQNAPYRPKIKLIKGVQLTVSESEATGIYQASFTAESSTNIYKVFVEHTLTPTKSGILALEYNAMLVGDMPNTSTANKAFSPYSQRLFTPVLTEEELSAEGTFFYDGTNHLIKFHPWNDSADGEYYIPDDDANNIISLQNMESVHMEDVKTIGCYGSCIYINKCDDVTLNACEAGYSGKGMGIKLDYTNARVSDCHAYAISVDGFNLHGYGYSEIVGCTAFHCGDDGISHHEGCSGFIDGGEWAYNGSGGITPAFGSQIDVRNANAHHNKIGIQWLGLANQSRYAKMCNCLSVDNITDVYVKWYVVEAWNNIFRTKNSQYNSARSALIEYGTVTPN